MVDGTLQDIIVINELMLISSFVHFFQTLMRRRSGYLKQADKSLFFFQSL